MKREKKWSYIDLNETKNKIQKVIISYRPHVKPSQTYHLFHSPYLKLANNDSKLGNNRLIPSLLQLREIKKKKLLRIKWLVQMDYYDTVERQKETTKRIIDSLLENEQSYSNLM